MLTAPKASAQQRRRPPRYLFSHRTWLIWMHLQGLWRTRRRMKKKTSSTLMKRRRGRTRLLERSKKLTELQRGSRKMWRRLLKKKRKPWRGWRRRHKNHRESLQRLG
jgi:hypothetical protein